MILMILMRVLCDDWLRYWLTIEINNLHNEENYFCFCKFKIISRFAVLKYPKGTKFHLKNYSRKSLLERQKFTSLWYLIPILKYFRSFYFYDRVIRLLSLFGITERESGLGKLGWHGISQKKKLLFPILRNERIKKG